MSEDQIQGALVRLQNEIAELRTTHADERVVLERITSFLRSELGYDSDTKGNLNQHGDELWKQVQTHETLFRGEGSQPGVLSWIHFFKRTWLGVIGGVCTLLGAIAGGLVVEFFSR